MLRAHLAPRLAAYKRPRHLILVDKLPAAATGKVLKARLTEIFAERVAALDERG